MDARIKSGMTNLDQRAGWFWTTSMDFTKRSTHPAICCLTGCLDYPTGKSVRVVIVACPAPFAKIFLFFRNGNQAISPTVPSHPEGRSRSSRTLERDAVDADGAK